MLEPTISLFLHRYQYFRTFLSKNIIKIYTKRHQIKFIERGADFTRMCFNNKVSLKIYMYTNMIKHMVNSRYFT